MMICLAYKVKMCGNDVAVSSLSIIPNDCNRGLGDYACNVCVSITWTWIIGLLGVRV